MLWALAGAGYAAAYVVAALLLGGHGDAALWLGNIAQLLPPLFPLAIILRRRREWLGRHRVFWDAVAFGVALWLVGQTAWAVYELALAHRLPVLGWTIVPEFCGSAMPLIALVAWPHRGQRPEASLMAVLDLYVLAAVAAFLEWSLVIMPSLPPSRSALAVQLASIVAPTVRVAVVAGLLVAARAAAGTPWAQAYRRLAAGSAVSLVLLLALSLTAGPERTIRPARRSISAGCCRSFSTRGPRPPCPRQSPSPVARSSTSGVPLRRRCCSARWPCCR